MLLTGVSARAMAESAVRAGFRVTAIDAFGDLDHHPAARVFAARRDLGIPFGPRAVAAAARSMTCDAVAYLSPFENHPRAVAAIAARHPLWGNPPAVLRRVRDPVVVMAALRGGGLPCPGVYRHAPPGDARLIVKPFRSGGGHRVRRWRRGTPVPAGAYVEDFVQGIPGSIVFAAADGRAVPLGVSRQIVGDAAFGVDAFRYCGSILDSAAGGRPEFAAAVHAHAASLAAFVARTFQLTGVNGIDFIVRDDVPVLIEVNPRWTSSMELVERATGIAMFGVHAAACRGDLWPAEAMAAAPRARILGKAIVFARESVAAPDTNAWLANPDIRDVPRPGERIGSGSPVCTVFAEGPDRETCYAALAARAGGIYASLTRAASVSPAC